MNYEAIEDSAAPRSFPWEKCPDEGTREHHTFLHRNVDALLRENAVLTAALQEVAECHDALSIALPKRVARETIKHVELQKINEAERLREAAEETG